MQSNKTTINFTSHITTNVTDINKCKISIFPNPTNGKIHITSEEQICHIALYNSNGSKIVSQELNATNYTLNIIHIPKGVFLIAVTTSNQIITREVVKE
ncbi:MAG: T9SS type A sorting domain-containing protein [Bacteroidales bacterium]|nr:T9SS type A sorting domain-containing protein [Bacteroidales bacterium]